LQKIFSNLDEFPVYVTENGTVLENTTETTSTIRIFGSAYAVGIRSIGEPLCWYLSGEIAGMIQALIGRFVKVTETSCWGLGHKYCDFFIEVLDEEISAIITSDSGKQEVQDRRNQFLLMLGESFSRFSSSLLMKNVIRTKIGDFIHISVVQQSLTALKLIDPFCGMLMYSAGSSYGLIGPGKHIIQDYMSDHGIDLPVSLHTAVKMLCIEMKHPTTMLARQHSFIEVSNVDSESVKMTIHENVYSAGASNVKEKFCNFTAGFINGRLRLLLDDEIIVKETACQGSGASSCTFEISLE